MRRVLIIACLMLWPFMASAAEITLQSLEGEHWYGLYMNGKKVGYSLSQLRIEDSGDVTAIEDASFKMNMVGLRQDMRIFSKRVYAASGELKHIESAVTDIAGTNTFKAKVEGDILILESKVGGQRSRRELPKPSESLLDVVKLLRLITDGAEIGASVSFSLFEPMYQTEIEGRSEIIDVEERVLEGVVMRVYKVKTVLDMMGLESISFVTEEGVTLEDRIAGGIITMRLEPEQVAKDVSYENDVIVSNAARVDKPIQNPRGRSSLRLIIEGPLESQHFFDDGRQDFLISDDKIVFEGRKLDAADLSSTTLPVEGAELERWLAPSLFVQSDNERLMSKAADIVGEEKDIFKASSLLAHWVYENVRTTFSARLTNSLEVLDNMEGDCTEHSMLYIGLARAAGIPAREAAGLIYVDRPQPGFYFHQWATVWVGQWIDVDPTFDQPIADATHIKLAEGDLFEQAKLLPIIGRISVEVIK